MFLPQRRGGCAIRLDQLQEKVAARTLEQETLGHDAEAHSLRQRPEAEELCIELDPVLGAIRVDVLHETEEMQVAQRRRMRIDRRNRSEVDVIDRELVVAVDEVDQAFPDAVNRGDIELHGPRTHRYLPCAQIERTAECIVRITHAYRKGADHRPL